MGDDLEARLDRLEIVVGSLLDELIECKQALKRAEDHIARSADNQKQGNIGLQMAQQRQAQVSQITLGMAQLQAQLSATGDFSSPTMSASLQSSNQLRGLSATGTWLDDCGSTAQPVPQSLLDRLKNSFG